METIDKNSISSPICEEARLSAAAWQLLRCPACSAEMRRDGDSLDCTGCGTRFPVVRGVPVLINERDSLFRIDQIVAGAAEAVPGAAGPFRKRVCSWLPRLNCNPRGPRNYEELAGRLLDLTSRPKVLIIGCGLRGAGIDVLSRSARIELIESDVCLGGGAKIVCDAHDLPLADESVDGVVIQAVLDDLIDPHRCIAEIHRVLKPQGLIYTETPFMQPVHDGWRDFGRWSLLGHRRMFRMFEEVGSGAVGGPGMALALMYQSFLLSLVTSRIGRMAMTVLARTTAFWLKYVDRLIIDRPAALDSASAMYFLGRKSDRPVADADLPGLYRGGQGGA